MDSNSKQYWLSVTGWLIFTERNEQTQFQNLPSCNEIVVLLQTCHVLSTHAVSTINSYISKMNKGESWLWKRKMVTHHQQTWFWNWNFKVHFSADEKNPETWLQLHSMSRDYFSFAESEFCSKCWADDVLCSSCIQTSRWYLIIAFSVWIFSETKTCKHQWYQKGSITCKLNMTMHVQHRYKQYQPIMPKCPAFGKPFCIPQSDVFHLFGLFFDTQLVHNCFCSSLKSPL